MPRDLTVPGPAIIALAKEAGQGILRDISDAQNLRVLRKPDGSSVTTADFNADDLIKERLEQLTPDIPVLSEEDMLEDQQRIMQQGMYWCVDPLDGTSNAIDYGKGHHSTNYFGTFIALIKDGVPIFGVAHYPAKDGGLTYYTNSEGTQAFRQRGEELPVPIHARKLTGDEVEVATRAESVPLLRGHKHMPTPGWGNGITRLAEGDVDATYFPPRTKKAGYWDAAATHAVLLAAGGDIHPILDDGTLSPEPMRYTADGYRGGGEPWVGSTLAATPELFNRLGISSPAQENQR